MHRVIFPSRSEFYPTMTTTRSDRCERASSTSPGATCKRYPMYSHGHTHETMPLPLNAARSKH